MEINEIVKHSSRGVITAFFGDVSFLEVNTVNGFKKKNCNVFEYFGSKNIEKVKDSLKMVLYDGDIYANFNSLSENDKKKIDLAYKLFAKKDIIILDYFEKGFSAKEVRFFKNLFKKLLKYNISIIIHTNDSEFLFGLCKRVCFVKDNLVTNIIDNVDWYDEEIYKFIEPSPIVKFVNNTNKNSVVLSNRCEISELIKDIYRVVN